ncbi:hypothetical protein D3C78_1132610 [compost metagenome]
MHDERNLAGAADQLSHFVCCERRCRHIVGSRSRNRNIAVDAGVEADHRNFVGFRFLQQRNRRFAVQRGKRDAIRLLVKRSLQHLDLLINLCFGLRAFEGNLHVELCCCLLGSLLYGLPELMLKPFGYNRNIELLISRIRAFSTCCRCVCLLAAAAARIVRASACAQHHDHRQKQNYSRHLFISFQYRSPLTLNELYASSLRLFASKRVIPR